MTSLGPRGWCLPLLLIPVFCLRAAPACIRPKQVEVYPFDSPFDEEHTGSGEAASAYGEAPVADADHPVMLMGTGSLGAEELVAFLLETNPDADPERVALLAGLYVEECAVEGVNSDVAFAQMCLETGFLRFGGLVSPDQNNFCGLGATGPGSPGHSFADERVGVRAHVQHMKAYASTEPLEHELVDPRFDLVSPRGRVPDIWALAGTWAADPDYGLKLADILQAMCP